MLFKGFDIKIPPDEGKISLLDHFYRFRIACRQEKNQVVIIIDEAQGLTGSVVEEVRMLSNLQEGSEVLRQVILLGQPDLRKRISTPALK
jgi:general secretion pathway protein A